MQSLFAPPVFLPLPVVVNTTTDFSGIGKVDIVSYQSPIGLFVALAYDGAFFEAAFTDDLEGCLAAMQQTYPTAHFVIGNEELAVAVSTIFQPANYATAKPISILLSGTPFQLNVWQALLKLPLGQTVSYTHVTAQLGDMGAIRAVGAAIGQNKLAFIVPCHRVVTKDGKAHNFKWGLETKKKLLGWEGAF